jgi:hypothetical protein
MSAAPTSSVDLYWLPLGAGDASRLVRWSGRAFEAIVARHQHRERRALYHSALEVRLDEVRHVIEMTPVWQTRAAERGVVGEGAVGIPWLGRSRLFRYEVRCWRGGTIPDVAEAVDSPRRLSTDPGRAQRVLDQVAAFPTRTWGRDEQQAGEMWNSNSLTSWLLATSGHETAHLAPPAGGRAPGWAAGLLVAGREPATPTPAGLSGLSGMRASRREVEAVMPGDEMVGQAKYRTTHAVSIDAPAEAVWPWLVQMGQGRGGLYSYDWLENLLGLDMHSADHVEPSLQLLEVGDVVRLVPEGTEPALQFAVARLDSPHLLVLGPDTSRTSAFAAGLPYPCWTFQVTSTGPATSRLVVRFQSDFNPTLMGLISCKYALKPVHFVMERKMLLGIKHRAELAA